MGLDVALGLVVLVAAFRGWFQGFVIQAVRLCALVAAVYGSGHVRDYAKPYVLPYLQSVRADVIDRLLWWACAVVTYLALVGIAALIIKITRRPEIPGMPQSGRNDQFAGFFLGIVKGVLIASFVAAGIQNYAMDQVKTVSWGEEQVKASWALKWNEAYQPARKVWASRPVRHFVDHIKRMGLLDPEEASATSPGDEIGTDPPVRTASRPSPSEGSGRDGHSGESSEGSGPAASSTPPAAEAVEAPTRTGDTQPKEAEKSEAGTAN